ncbi:MAG: flagellar export chaperone FlgN [Gammaproteobacteria bacterium]|nr:flagellar export chaperone FlgN [Gammaproteobacteria bacterium]
MNAADNLKKLTDLFTQARLCVEQLNECLLNELENLKTSNAEALIKNSQLKESLMLELHSIENKRKEITSAKNIKTKEEYLHWLDKLDNSTDLKNQWLELSQQILSCQKLNTENSIISENMASATQEALNILSGNKLPVDSTYTAQGTKPGNSASLHSTTA